MIELGLAVGASVAWGASDFVAGRTARERSVLLVLGGTQVVGLLLVAIAVLLAGEPMPGPRALGFAVAAGVCELTAFAALYAALASGPMGPVAPVAALGGVVPLGFHLAGGGALGPAAAVGVAAALVGVAFVSVEQRGGEPVSRRAVGLAAGSAVGFGLFFQLLAESSKSGDPLWSVGMTRAVAVAMTLSLLVVVHFRAGGRVPRVARGKPSPDLWWLAAAGTLDIVANALYALAVSRSTDVSVSIVGSLYPVTTVVLARFVLSEQMSRLQHAGAILTLVGVLLVGGV